ncbi:uncharacterized protein LOC131321254 [Rhododendron vialii]|uniref:uncharacterized protein LOC131321254 n=1 Tax=Rhododendron vialii TaxID=182163 RepID=UPI00265E62D1|nr:uncharacterized protein LOC131321254 [Rhododendron vialii]
MDSEYEAYPLTFMILILPVCKLLLINGYVSSLRSVSLHSHASSVPTLNGMNFSEWKEHVEFHLGVLDLDLALRCEKSAALTNTSSAETKSLHEGWERSNRLGLMFMRMTIANNIKITLPDADDAKVYLTSIETRFKQADKSLAGTLMAKLTTMKYDGSRGMHEHVLEMTNLAAQLKNLGMSMDEFFLVQFLELIVLVSLV